MTDKITVDMFVSEAIKEGIALSPIVYMEQLEAALKSDVLLTEAGSAVNYLQNLINEAENAQ
jgi:hypothetical protein